MQRLILLTMLLGVAAQQDATECGVARKHKKELANIFCNTASTGASSCDAACCEDNKLTCSGSGVVCPFDQYNAAPAGTPTTDATKVKDCCRPKVACQNTFYTCPAGMKQKKAADVAAIKCPGGPSTCAVGTLCCENDDTTCGGANNGAGFACDAGFNFGSKDNTWKAVKNAAGTAMIEAEYKKDTNCCTANPVCSSGTCPAGFKAKAGTENTACAGATCDHANTDKAACCEADASTCAGTPPTCAAGTYYPSADADWQAMPKDQCCTAVATCAAAKCPAGYKMKEKVEKTKCTGDADSCATGTDCCEKDVNSCGGLSGIACAYGFYNPSTTFTSKTPKAVSDAWKVRAANETNKNTNCCDKRAKCAEVAIATTTPAATTPAATTTPAIPIRRYSEHKIAVEKSSGASMLWLGAGAMIGMAALMVVKVVRSRIQQQSLEEDEDAREVGDLLLEDATVE